VLNREVRCGKRGLAEKIASFDPPTEAGEEDKEGKECRDDRPRPSAVLIRSNTAEDGCHRQEPVQYEQAAGEGLWWRTTWFARYPA
jgi:hypothetical protein